MRTMKKQVATQLGPIALFLVWASNALGASTSLPLRSEGQGTGLQTGVTTQTVESSFGASLMALNFSNTTTYDFYSPSLSVAASLAGDDKAGGKLFVKNTGTDPANDFKVSGRIRFYDYDPAQGTETLIADTTDSGHKDVHHGQTEKLSL